MAPSRQASSADDREHGRDDDGSGADSGGNGHIAESGLRARFHKRRAQVDDHVEFGVAQANSYFNARRIKRGPKKPAARAKTTTADGTGTGTGIGARKRTGSAAATRKRTTGAKRSSETRDSDSGSDAPSQRHRDEHGTLDEEGALVLPPRGEVLAALRIADELEAARRAANPKHALPTFDQYFPLWRSQLLANQNLLFYGVGSKLALLQRFADEHLDDGVVLQLHGYLPTVSMRYLSKFLHNEILRVHVRASQSLVQQCQDIVLLANKDVRRVLPRVHLVAHSIDGMAMRTPEIQTCLSYLATASFITVVASVDQINFTSMWKEEDSLRFQWVSQAVNTCLPYSDEIELRLSKQSNTTDQSSNGVKFILKSLTPTDVATLRIIAQHQLAATAGSAPSSGSSTTTHRKPAAGSAQADYQRVFEVCRKRLLHATILAMKNSVKCLEEHGLVRLLRVRNTEKLEIPLPEHIVKTEILQLSVGDSAAAAAAGNAQQRQKSGGGA